MELSKNDWKLFRERLPGWQERYMDKLTREYAEFLTDDRCQPSEIHVASVISFLDRRRENNYNAT